MKAVLLAGGSSQELRSLAQTIPKTLLEVAGKPILQYLIEKIETVPEVDEIFILTNKELEKPFQHWVSQLHSSKTCTLVIEPVSQHAPRGVVSALHYLLDSRRIDTDLLVVGGDNFFDFSLPNFIQYFQKKAASIVALHETEKIAKTTNYGFGTVNASKRIVDFQEKPISPASNLVGTCCYLFAKHDLKLFGTFAQEHHEHDLGFFIKWLSEHSDVYAYIFDTLWFDIGDIQSLKQAGSNVRVMNKNLLRRMLEEEVFDLRWASCLKQTPEMLNGHGPVIGSNPMKKNSFECLVEETNPVGYQNDVKLTCSIAQALLSLKHTSGTKQVVVVGKDIRAGTDFITRSFLNTLLRNPDITVLYVGEATTAYVAFCVNYLSKTHDITFGVQISASHTAWYKIGIEPVYGSHDDFHIAGSPFDADDLARLREATVEEELEPVLETHETTRFQDVSEQLFSNYLRTAKELVQSILGDTSDIRSSDLLMLLDTGNNISKKFAEALFSQEGFSYTLINKEYKYFPNRVNDPNHASVREMMQDRCNLISRPVLCAAFDTDADRSAFFDDSGAPIPGDLVGFVIAKWLREHVTGFFFQFEANNHLGTPILCSTNQKQIVCTVDVGLFLDWLDGVPVQRVSIGKPFLYSQVSRYLQDRTKNIIPHCDGPLMSVLFYGMCCRLSKKQKTLRDALRLSLPELDNYFVLRRDVDLANVVNSSAKTHMETKRSIVFRALEKLSQIGYSPTVFDEYTGILSRGDIRIFLRSSGHENFIIRASVEGKEQQHVQELLAHVEQLLRETAHTI